MGVKKLKDFVEHIEAGRWNIHCSECLKVNTAGRYYMAEFAALHFERLLGWTCDDQGAICQECKDDE